MPYYVYKSNNRLKDFISNTNVKPTSIDPSSRISYKTNTLVRALKTNQSNQSIHSCWSNLIPKLYKSKFPNYENSKTGRSQTPSKFAKNKGGSKNNKVFSSSQKRKAKIVFNSKKIGSKMIKLKGVKRERSKNLSSKKSEKNWLSKAKGDRPKKSNGAEYCYFQKKSKSKGKSITQKGKGQFSRSPGSIRQSNFSSIPKGRNSKIQRQPNDTKKSGKKESNRELKIWKLKNEYPGIIKGSTNSYMKSSAKMSKEILEGSSRKYPRKGKKVYSKTPKNNNYGLDAMKITFEYLSSNKNMEKQEKHLRTGTFMSNTSAGRLFSPGQDQVPSKNKDPMIIKKVSNMLFKPGPVPIKLSKNKLSTKGSKFQKLQINVDTQSKGLKRKPKPASTRVVTKTNFFPSKKVGKKKFCEYNGETGQSQKLKGRSGMKMRKEGLGKKMYLSKNENVWMDKNRKEWKGFSTCKNYLGTSKNFFAGSNLFGGRFHKEEKLVAEIVGINKQRYLQEDLEYGLKKSKTFKKGRKLSESIKKHNLKASKSKILKLSMEKEVPNW
jgi:hypothetical protein